MNYNIVIPLILIISVLMFYIYYVFVPIKGENIRDSLEINRDCVCVVVKEL